jgi:hypothetical protein
MIGHRIRQRKGRRLKSRAGIRTRTNQDKE